jgi:hypothetical protein
MPGEEICTLVNKHVEDCGKPPEFEFEEYDYISYFENQHGEQSLFLYDKQSNKVFIYIADAEWERPQVLSGKSLVNNKLTEGEDIGILPNSEELLWLKACKSAVVPRIQYQLSGDKN